MDGTIPVVHISLPKLPAQYVIACIAGLFFFLSMLVYGQSLRNDFVRWDDGLLIYENQAIREITPSSLKTIFTTYDPELYVPLTLLSYQIDYLIAGPRPQMYHFTNLILHTLNALLVACVSLFVTRKKSFGLLCGLLFLLHPLHTEAVAWSSARKDVLSTFFFLIGIITYYLALETNKNHWRIATFASYVLGLLAKVTVIPLPLILLLVCWKENGRISLKEIRNMIPFFGIGMVFAIIAVFGKTEVLSAVTPIETFAMACKSTVFYLQKLLWPTGLSVLYPYNKDIVALSADFLPHILLLIILIILTIISLKKTTSIVFCFGFFLLTLAPSLPNFAKAGTYYIASDRYAYIPSIGIFLLLCFTIEAIMRRIDLRKEAIIIPIIAIIGAMGFKAHAQSLTWKDTEALFENVLKYSSDSHVAYNNLGNIYREHGDIDASVKAYHKALAIRMAHDLPDDEENDDEARMEFETNIANALATNGNLDEAISHYNKAISAESNSKILANLGSAYRVKGDLKTAKEKYIQSLSLNPNNVQAMMGIGIVYQQTGDLKTAEQYFHDATENAPLFSAAHLNLGALYVQNGKFDEGIIHYDSAIEINPFFPQAHYNKGVALQKLDRNREALDAYMEAIRLAPTFVAARINAGILLAERRKFDEAEEQFEQVLLHDPANARAHAALEQLSALR